MAISDLFKDTCMVRRYTEGAQDEVGKPEKIWGDHLPDQACRLTAAPMGAGREIRTGAEVIIAEYTLYLPFVDITERDEVIIGGITYEVILVTEHAALANDHHKKAYLRTIR